MNLKWRWKRQRMNMWRDRLKKIANFLFERWLEIVLSRDHVSLSLLQTAFHEESIEENLVGLRINIRLCCNQANQRFFWLSPYWWKKNLFKSFISRSVYSLKVPFKQNAQSFLIKPKPLFKYHHQSQLKWIWLFQALLICHL